MDCRTHHEVSVQNKACCDKGILTYYTAILGMGLISRKGRQGKAYVTLLYTLLLLDFVFGVIGFAKRHELQMLTGDREWEGYLLITMAYYGSDSWYEVTKFWSWTQRNFHCCGVLGYKDWLKMSRFQQENKPMVNFTTMLPDYDNDVPGCCCINSDGLTDSPGPSCGYYVAGKTEEEAKKTIYTQGCISALQDQMVMQADIFSGVLLGLAAITAFTLIAVGVLKNKKKADLLRNNNRLQE